MKKTFTILALLTGLTGFTQTTQTIVVHDSISIPLTSTVNFNINGSVGMNTNPPYIEFPNIPNIPAFRVVSSMPFTDTVRLSTTVNISAYDSIIVKAKLATFNQNISTVRLYGSDSVCNVTAIFTPGGTDANWQQYSVKVKDQAILNSNTITFKIDLFSRLFISKLHIIGYRDSLHTTIPTNTTTPTQTTTPTGIKIFENSNLNLFVIDNVIKSNVSNDNLILTVFDLSGKQVLKTMLKNEIETNLTSGIYILNVFNQSGSLIERKRVLISEQ